MSAQRKVSTSASVHFRTVAAALVALFLGLEAPRGIAAQSPSQPHASPDSASRSQRVGRIVGVFDSETSAALTNAEVVDVLSERSFRTAQSGLIGLAGFREQHDSAVVRIRKLGYADTTLLIMVGVADTVPIQLFLRRVTTLPRVVTEAMETKTGTGTLREIAALANDRSLHANYILPADMRKHDELRLRDILPSIGYGKLRCTLPTVYLDGHKVDVYDAAKMPHTNNEKFNGRRVAGDTSGGEISLDDLVAQYEAAEFFLDFTAPLPYGPCTLLLWTRGT